MAVKKEGTKFVPYKFAIMIVQYYGIRSRSEYWQWRKKNNIQYLPAMPDRVYSNWEGWNIFLNQQNSFDKTKFVHVPWRPFWEAVRWAQKAATEHNINTHREWLQFHREGNAPKDIPRNPDQIYPEFTGKGWNVWLGKSVRGKVMTEQQARQLFAVFQYTTNSQPANMIVAKLFKGGESEGMEFLNENPDLKVLKAFEWDSERSSFIKSLFDNLASEQGANQYLVNNLNDLLFELSAELKSWA